MRKLLVFFLFFFLGSTAMADKIGLNLGLYGERFYLLDTDTEDYFLTPLLEYDHSFGTVDLYLKGEYTFCLTNPFPQFFFSKEKITAHLPLSSASELQFRLTNETNVRFNPDRNDGRVQPELGYGLVFPAGDVSLALGFPLTYQFGGSADPLFGVALTAAYSTPFWLGLKAMADWTLVSEVAFDTLELVINFMQDQFYAEIAFKATESFDYLSLTPEFDYFIDSFTFWAGMEFGGLGCTLSISPTIGVKYRF